MGRTTPTSRELDDAYKVGHSDGLAKGRQEILDWLEHAYIHDPGRPDRGTPQADAILELARAAQNHFMTKLKTNRKRGSRRG